MWAYSVKNDHAFVGPVLAVGAAGGVEEGQQGVDLGVSAAFEAEAPVAQLSPAGRAQQPGDHWSWTHQVFGFVLLPQALFLVSLALAEDVVVVVVRQASPPLASGNAQGLTEGIRARQEPLLPAAW